MTDKKHHCQYIRQSAQTLKLYQKLVFGISNGLTVNVGCHTHIFSHNNIITYDIVNVYFYLFCILTINIIIYLLSNLI